MSRVLITGSGGFVGGALSEHLRAAGWEVWGVDCVAAVPGEPERLSGDLTDAATVADAIARAKPDAIVHLAAQSSVRQSFDTPAETIAQNTLPALHILHELKTSGRRTRLLLVGSADEYGVIDANALPVREDATVRPQSPYALAKSIQNQYGAMFAQLYDVDVVMTRSFNHTGPGQRDAFVLPGFARQVVEIRAGTREAVIAAGNLDVRRDFLDVRDVCSAYAAILDEGKRGETYNVCSGESHSIRDLLDRLCALCGVTVKVRVDPERLRPVDMPELRGDATRLQRDTGWKPTIAIDNTLRSLLDYWAQRVR